VKAGKFVEVQQVEVVGASSRMQTGSQLPAASLACDSESNAARSRLRASEWKLSSGSTPTSTSTPPGHFPLGGRLSALSSMMTPVSHPFLDSFSFSACMILFFNCDMDKSSADVSGVTSSLIPGKGPRVWLSHRFQKGRKFGTHPKQGDASITLRRWTPGSLITWHLEEALA